MKDFPAVSAFACVALAAAFIAPACGSDTVTRSSDGGIISGGAGGEGGDSGSGSGSGTVGAGGVPSTPSNPSLEEGGLGDRCDGDADCNDGLRCVTEDSDEFEPFDGVVGGPARGFCSVECSDDPAICLDFDPTSLCGTVNSDETAYCFQGCSFGPPTSGAFQATKCHGRTEFACNAVFPTNGQPCTTSTECGAAGICFQEQCFFEVPICVPQCNDDIDCPDGRRCQLAPSFTSPGVCTDSDPVGLPPGAECELDAEETDEICAGTCLPAVSNEEGDILLASCTDTCTVGASPVCGFDGEEGQAARCLRFAQTDGVGDGGLCVRLCDCNDECPGIERCVRFKDPNGDPVRSDPEEKAGVCIYPFDSEGDLIDDFQLDDPEPGPVELIECGSGGAGGSGAGGAPAGSGGAGDAGAGGA